MHQIQREMKQTCQRLIAVPSGGSQSRFTGPQGKWKWTEHVLCGEVCHRRASICYTWSFLIHEQQVELDY